ncbi:hypothetical protein EDB89DRAFT_1986512 [Lactarius sanguifluus]|nr:hypothetical protein EDB89DRAFT_1986512 [Lactarius sanguifluus]
MIVGTHVVFPSETLSVSESSHLSYGSVSSGVKDNDFVVLKVEKPQPMPTASTSTSTTSPVSALPPADPTVPACLALMKCSPWPVKSYFSKFCTLSALVHALYTHAHFVRWRFTIFPCSVRARLPHSFRTLHFAFQRSPVPLFNRCTFFPQPAFPSI